MTCGSDATPKGAEDGDKVKGIPHLVKKKESTGGPPDTIPVPKPPTLSNLPGSGSSITCPKNKLTATPL